MQTSIASKLLLILKVIYTKMNKTGKDEIDKAKKLASLSVAYILRLISEGKNDEQTAERFDGNAKLVKDCI